MEKLIKEFGLKNPQKVFEGVKNYQDLVEASVGFLEGKVSGTPVHPGPIDKETIPLVKDLVKINKLGFVTTQGQPPACYHNKFIKEKWTDSKGAELGNWYVDSEQKGYSMGMLKREYLEDFIDFFNNEKYYYYSIVGKEGLIKDTFLEEHYNVTRDRANKSKINLKQESWDKYTNIHKDSAIAEYKDTKASYPKNKEIDDAVLITITGSEYCNFPVEKVLLKFLKTLDKKSQSKRKTISKKTPSKTKTISKKQTVKKTLVGSLKNALKKAFKQ